jgi:hypothetical protein
MPPLARAYFATFETELKTRPHYLRHFAASGKPYWSMYNVGPYTFAPYRVVWREQSARFECAVIEGRIVADAKLIVTPCSSREEAHYLSAMLNSAPARAFVEAYVIPVQISTHVLKRLAVPAYDAADRRHGELAELSMRCHAGDDASRCESRIDEIARELWGIRRP